MMLDTDTLRNKFEKSSTAREEEEEAQDRWPLLATLLAGGTVLGAAGYARKHGLGEELSGLLSGLAGSGGASSVGAGALYGALAGGALPAAATAQYAAWDLPKYRRQIDQYLSEVPVIRGPRYNRLLDRYIIEDSAIRGSNSSKLRALATPGRVVITGEAVEPLRNVLSSAWNVAKGVEGGNTLDKWRKIPGEFSKAFDAKFDLGYGSTAASGSAHRHAAVLGDRGIALDKHPAPPVDRSSRAEINRSILRSMSTEEGLKAYKDGIDTYLSDFVYPDGKPRFTLVGEFDSPDMKKTMQAAYANSASLYNDRGAVRTGLLNVLMPRLPVGKGSDISKIVCRDGYCSSQIEDAFGLSNKFGFKTQLPGHLTLRDDFKPLGIVASDMNPFRGKLVDQVGDMWKAQLGANAKRRIGLGLAGMLGLAGAGAGIGAGVGKATDTARDLFSKG